MALRARAPRIVAWALLALGLATVVAILAATPVATNAWFVMTEPAYVIPRESSLWRFSATEMNEGSGDWWIYGKDDRNYYHFTGIEEVPYIALNKVDAAACAGFDSTDISTWCR